MATVTGLTAERMLEIEAASVVDGDVVGGHLILTKHDGTQFDAGTVIGPVGPEGPVGNDLEVLTNRQIHFVGHGLQCRAGRELVVADFTDLDLSAPIALYSYTADDGGDRDTSGNNRHILVVGAPEFEEAWGLSDTAIKLPGVTTNCIVYRLDTGTNDPFRIRVGSVGTWFKARRHPTPMVAPMLSKYGNAAGLNNYWLTVEPAGLLII